LLAFAQSLDAMLTINTSINLVVPPAVIPSSAAVGAVDNFGDLEVVPIHAHDLPSTELRSRSHSGFSFMEEILRDLSCNARFTSSRSLIFSLSLSPGRETAPPEER
jgi:hypothetical protein